MKIKIPLILSILFFGFSYFNSFVHAQIPIPQNPLTVDANTISLWRFNDVSGNTVTDETGRNNGAAIGASIADGKFDKARYFNGSSDYIRVPNNPSLNNLSQITIEAWVYPSGFDLQCWALDEGLVIKGDSTDFYASNAYGIQMVRNYDSSSDCVSASSFKTIRFGMSFGSAGASSFEHFPNQWYYVVGTFDGSKARIYINGVEENSGIAPAQIVANSRDLYMNHHTWSGGYSSSQRMRGLIDEVRISNIDRYAAMPPAISSLQQFKSDGVTSISEGATTTENTVTFGAKLQSQTSNPIRFEVEIQPFGTNFTNIPNATSSLVTSGQMASTTIANLSDGSYHWQARAVDTVTNTASSWQEFGTAGNVDFIVALPLSYKAATLAKLVINAPYLGDGDTYGGKGWDHKQSLYVSSNNIFDGYNYWNNKLRTIAFGAGLDCSGLVEWAFNRSFDPRKSLLLNVIRYDGADGQYQNNTETVTENNLQPGDLLFLDKDNDNYIDHVAMYVGESGGYNIMEAYSPAEGIVPANKTEFKTRTGFDQNKHIRRVAISPSLGGQVKAGSPIDLIVTDPEGFTITPTTAIQTDNEYLREIPRELYYAEGEIGSDGKPKDIVYWPKQKIGDYVVKVLPETGVSLIETYSLEFTSGDQTTIFAENIPLSQIPSEGYGVVVEENGSINPFIPISIDIKPDSLPNSINIGSGGIVPVAIFGTATFNVAQINLATITLANAPIKPKKNGQLIASYSDVNEDGFTDVVVHIITEALQLTSLDVKAELNGSLLDGSKIKGSDSVRIVP